MSKATLVDVIREQTECTVNSAKEAVDAIFDAISKTLKKEGSMSIVGFGTFKVSKRGARTGRNPQTGAPIKIAASRTVRFKASKQLKEAI
jgi:nucleoid DNA-binding protein